MLDCMVGQIHYELRVHDKSQQFGFVGFYCTLKYSDVALFVESNEQMSPLKCYLFFSKLVDM